MKGPEPGHAFRRWPSIWPSRSFISRAALLVKVTDRISPGRARPKLRMWAMRQVSTRVFPVPAPASTSTWSVQRLHRLALLGIEAGKILRGRGRTRRARRCRQPRAGGRGRRDGSACSAQSCESSSPTMAPRGREGEPS